MGENRDKATPPPPPWKKRHSRIVKIKYYIK